MGDLVIKLVDRFMQHPVVWIHLARGKIGAAVGLTIKSLSPAQTRIDPAEFVAVLEQLYLKSWVCSPKIHQFSKTVRVSGIEKLQGTGSLLRLLSRRTG